MDDQSDEVHDEFQKDIVFIENASSDSENDLKREEVLSLPGMLLSFDVPSLNLNIWLTGVEPQSSTHGKKLVKKIVKSLSIVEAIKMLCHLV